MVFKYLNADEELLGISVLDYRADPLRSKGVTACKATISSSDLGISAENITAVQVEVY